MILAIFFLLSKYIYIFVYFNKINNNKNIKNIQFQSQYKKIIIVIINYNLGSKSYLFIVKIKNEY